MKKKLTRYFILKDRWLLPIKSNGRNYDFECGSCVTRMRFYTKLWSSLSPNIILFEKEEDMAWGQKRKREKEKEKVKDKGNSPDKWRELYKIYSLIWHFHIAQIDSLYNHVY